MQAPTTDNPDLTPNDRIGLSIFSSSLVHVLIILGISFTLPDFRELAGIPNLEITLVQTASDAAPDKADYLAQANQDGGGNSATPDIASSPLPLQEISDEDNPLPMQQPQPQPPVPSAEERPELLTQERADTRVADLDASPKNKIEQPPVAMPGLATRFDPDQERARLNAELSRSWQEYQQRPKRKFLTARTREYKYAAYMDAWRAKVERVGNLNYPDEALRRGLSGSLVLDVALKADGSVDDISVRRSSGYKLLDDAAVRIVSLAQPFAPFPPNIRKEADVIHITRTWKFNPNGLSSEN